LLGVNSKFRQLLFTAFSPQVKVYIPTMAQEVALFV